MSAEKTWNSKLQTLYDRYRDRDIVKNAQNEIEDIRRRTFLVSATTSAIAFIGNEFVRLTMRSRTNLAPL